VFSSVGKRSDDPDAETLGEWLRKGAPIGLLNEICCNGVFPTVPKRESDNSDLAWLASDWGGGFSHKSATDKADKTKELLQEAADKGFAELFDSAEELADATGFEAVTLNPLGLLEKTKSDGTIKYRIIWDLLKSRVNEVVSQGERIILPGIFDVVLDIIALYRRCETHESVVMLVIDICDAFNNIPVRENERRFTCAEVDGKFVVFKSLVFGSGSSPTVWGRFAAFAGRFIMSLFF
jgi:hypothetical protein